MNEQLELGEDFSGEEIFEMEKTGNYTGSVFRRLYPDKVRLIHRLRAEKMGIQRIASLVKCSTHTVMLIDREDASDIATLKDDIGQRALTAGKLCIEQVIEDVLAGKLEGRDAAVAAGIMIDKGLVLKGEATAITEVREGMSPDDFKEWFDGQLKEVSGREVEPETHRSGEGTFSKGDDGSPAPAALPEPKERETLEDLTGQDTTEDGSLGVLPSDSST